MSDTEAPEGSPRSSRVEAVHIVLPGLTNALGNIFGGQLMQWLDIAGAIAASRHSRAIVVTASMDRVHFMAPVKLGQVVIVQAQVNYAAHTSMEVGVRVWGEERTTRRRFQATRAYLTFVAIDQAGKPVAIPKVVCEDDEDRRRFAAAERRRADRLSDRRAVETRAARKT